MKSKLVVLSLLAVVLIVIGVISSAEGDCDSGIKAVHLDPDPNDFCDDVTIEIDPNKGLQIKNGGIKAAHLDPDPDDFCDGATLEIDPNNGLQVKAIPADSVLPAKVDSIFGSWTDKDSENNTLVGNAVYKAGSDGIVTAYVWDGHLDGYTDSSNPPTTIRVYHHLYHSGSGSGITLPVRKNDYWKVVSTATIYWLPLGNGSCVKQ